MFKIKFLFICSLLVAYGSVSLAESVRIKNGRHYIMYLSTALEVPAYEIEILFEDLKSNLPKEGVSTEFYSAKDSVAKIADYMCGVVSEMGGESLDYIYERLLNRKPTDDERSKVITVDGEFSFYANCFVIALHPEVLKDD